MPIIEAQTIGVPVVTSAHHPCGRRRVGAVLADPDDADDIHRPSRPFLESRDEAHDIVELGFGECRPVLRCSIGCAQLLPSDRALVPASGQMRLWRKRCTSNQRSGFITILPSWSNRK